jgi:hypothetical protein
MARSTPTGAPSTPTGAPSTPTGAPSTPTGTPTTPTRAQTAFTGERTPPEQVQAVESARSSGDVQDVVYDRPQKSRKKLLVGGVALLVPIVAGAIFMSQGAGKGSSDVTTPAAMAIVDADSAQVAPPVGAIAESVRVAPPPALVPESMKVVTPVVDPKAKAIADSLKKAARAAAAKKTAALTDSVRKAQETPRLRARRAVSELLANESARRSLAQGATRKGGLLGAKRKGDLQTQIDALMPFLTSANLTYDQFKGIVQASGVRIFDEFGRMIPDSLARFAR